MTFFLKKGKSEGVVFKTDPLVSVFHRQVNNLFKLGHCLFFIQAAAALYFFWKIIKAHPDQDTLLFKRLFLLIVYLSSVRLPSFLKGFPVLVVASML
jgi:hypothetical protein